MFKKDKNKFGWDIQYLKFIKAFSLCKEEVNYPFQWLMIEPTNNCNLHCVMCPQSGKIKRKKGFMKYELFKKIIDEVSGTVKSVQLFHSGESFLHPEIFNMISYTASNNIYSLINTNGTLLDENKARSVLDSGLSSISFSFDTFDKKTYESIRVGAPFEKTLKNIESFLKLKAQKRQKLPHTIIEIIEMRDTTAHIDTFYQKAKEIGFDEVRTWKFHNWTKNDIVNDQHNPYTINKNSYYPCEYPFFLMAIYWDGTVVPCCFDYNEGYNLGNVNDSSLMTIWNDQQIRKLRSTMRGKNTPKITLCRECSLLREARSSRSLAGRLFRLYSKFIGMLR